MKKISTAALRELEVINLCGGERIGYPCDFEFDLDDERILSIIVPSSESVSIFGKREEYVIPWCKVECIGEDAILIKMPQNEIADCCCSSKGVKKRGWFK